MVEVAVINWNTAAAALAAARAFLRSEGVEVEVTIVDNASRPEERRRLEAAAGGEEGRLRVLLPERNLGYGAAANLALSGGRAPLVCVSNADVAPEPRALAELVAAAGVEDAGMVGPVFAGGTQHYHSRLPGRAALLARPFLGSAGKAPPLAPRPGEVLEVEQASGACFAMRRETWEALGGFDEGYFLWYDDVDLARRLHDGGRRNLVVGSSIVRHLGAASFAQIDPRTAQAIRLASLRRYIDKHHPELSWKARPLLAAARALRARGAAPPPGG